MEDLILLNYESYSKQTTYSMQLLLNHNDVFIFQKQKTHPKTHMESAAI
jgi:hypothetical protein